ncbi:UDP-N-acetylmuramoyl-tripeptide--D-alanyl-D-alanine ligase [Fodinibius halophilus]|uniref:UDP-N-acetylmuramoyl-tripeptide--D-alanyl-D-alanine ligase n=1 Tax=Fodinibius halophilus TaxID=1736908 RepID=A0A6M1SU38_9BACT|nr:UDP-N-acetylmuramoyl-tripeptide--D-alanyl-D-alanine ligase [Fodinibius halophilus]NGP87468.1 UDP-N-acetylmuramoyl-tripeptide--D-alanyl-D-alanine ligase [Fodinibius halophilus]
MNWYLHFIDLLILAFVIVLARHTFLRGRFFLHIFQQHGYKLNEYWHWLFDNWNRRVVTPEHILYNIVIVVLLFVMSNTVTGSTAIVILSLFGIFWFAPFNYYGNEEVKKPLVFTPRMIRLTVPFVILSLLLPILVTYISYSGRIPFTGYGLKNQGLYAADMYLLGFGWVFANALIPFLIFIAGTLTKPIEAYVHRHFIKLAQKKLSQMPELTVIAITGSYGKTSTKFMIRDLLSERYAVCSTPGSYNTPMGICKVINNDLEAQHQVLVLEMGARYEGNIDELCDIAEPDISVVTNVGVAHLETFGSQDAIARTKSTIVSRTQPNGKAVLNADDKRVHAMAELRDDLEITKVGLEKGDIRGTNIQYGPDGMQFTVTSNGDSETFNMKLLGSHNVQNMLLAVGVARALDIRLTTMAMAASRIAPVEHRLELKKQGELTVIDDAFNSNPVGARNAVETLSAFDTGRRIIITPGMIELGELQAEKNYQFGVQIGEADLDLAVLVGQQQTKPIKEGIASTDFDMQKVQTVNSLNEANEKVQDFAQNGDIILYENDLPDSFNE